MCVGGSELVSAGGLMRESERERAHREVADEKRVEEKRKEMDKMRTTRTMRNRGIYLHCMAHVLLAES